jgi:uncharacterized membrane protein
MEKRAQIANRPVKPMFLTLPAALLPSGFVLDVAYHLTGRPIWAQTALWMIAAGTGCALIAAIFGFVDGASLPAQSRARRMSFVHSAVDLVVAAVFAVGLLSRRSDPLLAASAAAMVLEFIGVALHTGNVRLGGELLRELGFGVAATRAHAASRAYRAATDGVRTRH